MKLIIDIPEAEYEDIKYFGTIVDESRDYIASSILNGTPLDKIRNELINRYPKNYAGELELGGSACHFSLNEILEIINRYKERSE